MNVAVVAVYAVWFTASAVVVRSLTLQLQPLGAFTPPVPLNVKIRPPAAAAHIPVPTNDPAPVPPSWVWIAHEPEFAGLVPMLIWAVV